MAKKYFPKLKLNHNDYEIPDRLPGERIREIGFVDIDRSVFKKTKAEKLQLKFAKSQAKIDEMRR
jgi:hypothetical protein